jgi:hypothetical protein
MSDKANAYRYRIIRVQPFRILLLGMKERTEEQPFSIALDLLAVLLLFMPSVRRIIAEIDKAVTLSLSCHVGCRQVMADKGLA